ncbi:helix-turn-helix transcriptional regulator [Thiorhodococcus minor]|uniref:Helix-turn-helix transcriptional regulator n=1 Tax=Thiorhodococcus minor TaxID=57489 RepID=A0A6M0JT53_9GAMM|nr:helix-turn-helix transcriptional regulator [Thiorhodococcus minor]NEV60710.1 helix-turn-helix transcriptional regulator [Thiorhodococcus minor]
MKDPLNASKQQVLGLVNSLYALQGEELISDRVLASLQEFVPFDAGALYQIDRTTYEIAQGKCSGKDAGLIRAYLQKHASTDPCSLSTRCPTRLNQPSKLSSVLARHPDAALTVQRARTRFGFEHALTVVAGWRGGAIALLRLHRRASRSDFTDHELELIGGIAPHIAMSMVFNEANDSHSAAPQTGLLALTGDNQLVYANDSVQELLSEAAPEAIRYLAESKSVWRSQGDRVFRLRILPLGDRSLLSWIDREARALPHCIGQGKAAPVIVIAVEPIQRRQALATRLVHSRLSRREVEVALCVMRGLSNADIAAELSIDEKTVKDHLRRIYGKIDVRSRTAMISKVLGLEAELTAISASATSPRSPQQRTRSPSPELEQC